MFSLGGSDIAVLLLYVFFVFILPLIFISIVSYIVYKKLKGPSAEEIEEAKRINSGTSILNDEKPAFGPK